MNFHQKSDKSYIDLKKIRFSEKTEKNIFNQIIQPTNELFVIN